jgi:hypothetical protein
MLNKLNDRIKGLQRDLENMLVDPKDSVIEKLKDAKSDIESFQEKLDAFKEWIQSGINFLK